MQWAEPAGRGHTHCLTHLSLLRNCVSASGPLRRELRRVGSRGELDLGGCVLLLFGLVLFENVGLQPEQRKGEGGITFLSRGNEMLKLECRDIF